MPKKKLLVIYGPTAIGKTSIGIKLAKDYQGEIISADSRQIYQGLDIGTGKDLEKGAKFVDKSKEFEGITGFKVGYYLFSNTKAWLLDVISPDERFSAYQWSDLAKKVITDIWKRNGLPIIVGGSAFYLKALLDGLDTQGIEPDWNLRKELGKLTLAQLQRKAGKANPLRWEQLNQSDRSNPRRLMRLIEVGLMKGKKKDDFFKEIDILGIYLNGCLEFLRKRIGKRVEQRLEKGLVEEVKALLENYSWEDPGLNCLAYKEFRGYFEKRKSLEEVKKEWLKDEVAYAKRQKLWFRDDSRFVKFNREGENYLDKIKVKMKQWEDGKEKK